MATLRAMHQLRPGLSSTSSSPQATTTLATSSSAAHAHGCLIAYSQSHSPLQPKSSSHAPSHSYSPLQPPAETAPNFAAGTFPPSLESGTMTTSAAPARSTIVTNMSKKALNLGLHSGAASGNLGLVKFALDNGQPIGSVVNGVLPIHAACCSNVNVAVALFLIERGADVNARRYPRKYSGERVLGAQTVGTTGSTPLHFAAANGCLAIVEILLRHGATADLADKYGSTPYSVATARNHPDIASLLQQHASMQRGLQVLTPDADLRDSRDRDPFTSPRTSGDFSRRVSAIMAPTRPFNQQAEASSSQSLPTTSNIPSSATPAAVAGDLSQRRVSLPSIMESPSSPTASTAPRQSCDIWRAPLSRESLSSRSESTEARLLTITHRMVPSTYGSTFPVRDKAPRSHSAQNSLQSTLEPTPTTTRRRSVDTTAAGYLSPPAPRTILRRVSLDLIRAVRPVDGKYRRDSDASTSETMVSSPSSYSTLVSPMMMMGGNGSRTLLNRVLDKPSAEFQAESSPMGRSVSQSPLSPESGASHKHSKRSTRRSFDLRMFAAPVERTMAEAEEEDDVRSNRRHSMHIPFAKDCHEEKTFYAHPSRMTSSTSSASSQELSHRESNRATKHRASFSGSATISGRFSRLWSYGSGKESQGEGHHGKDGFAGSMASHGLELSLGLDRGNWSTSEFAKADPSASAEDMSVIYESKEAGGPKSKAGMMNRVSGMWARR